MGYGRILVGFSFLVITGCSVGSGGGIKYTPPEASGLIGVRAYPGPRDNCMVIGENELTSNYLGDASLLIGCPVHETGAINNRLAEGAQQLSQVGAWVLLSVPQR